MSTFLPILIGAMVFTLFGIFQVRYPHVFRNSLNMMSDKSSDELAIALGWIFAGLGASILVLLLIYFISTIVRSAVGI